MAALHQTDFTQAENQDDFLLAKLVLNKHDRSRILEVYFNRIDNKTPEFVPQEFEDLYRVELKHIKTFLLNQRPYDQLLHRIFGIMN